VEALLEIVITEHMHNWGAKSVESLTNQLRALANTMGG